MRVTHFALAGALVGVGAPVLGAGCGASDRPPTLGDFAGEPPSAGGAAAGFAEAGAPLAPQECSAGPQNDVCGCVDLTLLSDAPNLYFLLDRSGSMNEDDRWTTVRTTVAALTRKLGPRGRYGVAVFPGPSGSPCDPGAEVMALRAGDAPGAKRGPTTELLLDATNMTAAGGTPTAASLRAVLPRLSALSGRTFVILATDGGPNCNAAASCGADRCIPNIEGASEQCRPGGPVNCCSRGGDNCLDADATVEAVAALKSRGIPTYVLGVPGSAPYADVLDRAAVAGGTARMGSPAYYRVDSAAGEALTAALSAIAAKITATCDIALDQVPDPNRVNVYLDEEVVAQEPDNGWVLDAKTVRLRGRTCSRVLAGEALGVRVVAGCPTVVPK